MTVVDTLPPPDPADLISDGQNPPDVPADPTVTSPFDYSRCVACGRAVFRDLLDGVVVWVHWNPKIDRDHGAIVSEKDAAG